MSPLKLRLAEAASTNGSEVLRRIASLSRALSAAPYKEEFEMPVSAQAHDARNSALVQKAFMGAFQHRASLAHFVVGADKFIGNR